MSRSNLNAESSIRHRRIGGDEEEAEKNSSENSQSSRASLLADQVQGGQDGDIFHRDEKSPLETTLCTTLPVSIAKKDDEGDSSTASDARLEKALSEDIYSLMYTADIKGPAFWFACSVFAIQLTILVLIFLDLVILTKDPPVASNGQVNRLQIAPGTPVSVSVAQFFGVALTISFTASQGDLVKGFEHLVNGYDENVKKQNQFAKRGKYVAAGVFQSLVGILMTTDLFILLMQSTSVIGMCLNFAALHFVQEIDDVAFMFASMGLLSQSIQLECLSVGDIMIAAKVRQRTWRFRRILMWFLLIGLYSAYFVISYQQWSGRFRCTTIYVQFGDAYHSELAYYSGRFLSQGNSLVNRNNGRHYFLDESETILLRYSTSENAWIFQYADAPDAPYLIKSAETDSFDVTTLGDSKWYTDTPSGLHTVDWIAVACNHCNTQACNPSHGKCVNDICVCEEGRLGINCEHAELSCGFFGLDLRTKVGVSNIPAASFFFDNEFAATNYILAERNIFMAVNFRELDASNFNYTATPALMIFSGRRWIIFGTKEASTDELTILDFDDFYYENDLASKSTPDALALLGNASEDLSPIFFSSPVDFGTPSFGYDPRSVTWVFAAKDETPNAVLGYKPIDDDPVPAKLLCTDCTEGEGEGSCKNEGLCDGIFCSCPPFYKGFQCEYVYSCNEIGCFGGGRCDELTGQCRDCLPDYTGNLCQFPFPANVTKDPYFCSQPSPIVGPCKNRQACDPFGLKCDCNPPFYGELCELSTQPNCSVPGNACENGGVCDASYDNPICRTVS